jgi:CRISPR-associated protein Cmr6
VDQEGRSAWLRDLKTDAVGTRSDLQAKSEKIQQLAASQGGQTRVYQCTAPFVTGMGNPHPLENGFTWHPTLGTPYLPGSAVKGLVRAAVELAYQGEDKTALLQRWFGTAEKKDEVPENSGSFIFLDALPTAPCALVPEVMTPHMGKWYEKGGKTPTAKDTQPGDWHNPVPVGYLTARDLQLQFAIMPRPGVAADELAQVWQALDYALQWLGAGGKTAQGFGAMEINQAVERKRQQAQADAAKAQHLASLSPAQQRIAIFVDAMRNQHAQYPKFKDKLNGTYHNKARELATAAAHESAVWSAEDKLAAAQAIEEWLPKLVAVDMKDERKKLKLSALKGL